MTRITFLFMGVFLWITPWVSAQNVDTITNQHSQQGLHLFLWEEALEELAKDSEVSDWEEELEELAHRFKEPLNLNVATKRQLEQFPFLNDRQIENLLAYLYFHGPMQTLYELQAVEAMDRHTLDLLLPFVCVQPVRQPKKFPRWKDIWRYGRHEWLTRFDVPLYTRKGYENAYVGPSVYHSLRYAFRYGDAVQAGILGEKDAGEPMFAMHNARGYDVYSFYLLIQHLGKIQALAIGNYRLSFGQGLVLGQGLGGGKSFSLATSDYRSQGIRKHSSADEYRYFQGAAATVEIIPRVQVSAFYSHRALDGVVEQGRITSIYKTGLHRTSSEAAKKHAFAMQVYGGNVAYDHGAFHMGATGMYYAFSRPYQPRLQGYAAYQLHGNHFYNLSADYRFCWGKWMASGEIAKSKKGYAWLHRVQYAFSRHYRIMLLHRYYAHDHWSFFGRAFGEKSGVQNENGWYVAAEASPVARWRVFGSLDFFSFPAWSYRISKSSKGWEGRWQATYTPRKNLLVLMNYRYKFKERDVAGTQGKVTEHTGHHRIRGRVNYLPGNWRWQTTVDYTLFQAARSGVGQGWQMTQTGGYQCTKLPLSVTLQGTYFHTDNYDSRVYAYEKGLLYTFYTPSFFGRGFRCSAHVRYDANEHITALLKIAHTYYQDRDVIGTGLEQIASPRKTDVCLQVRFKF